MIKKLAIAFAVIVLLLLGFIAGFLSEKREKRHESADTAASAAVLKEYYARYSLGFAGDNSLLSLVKTENRGKITEIDKLCTRWIAEEHLYNDVPGHFISEVARLSGHEIPPEIDFDQGLLKSFTNILKGHSRGFRIKQPGK
ncbi:MAG: hypothetical protein AB2L14_01100 [Candidatus Xenobiia bacterium LiM19]